MLFVARGFRIALLADDGFSKLLAAGLTFAFALQTFIIVGGILRVIPLTGITLPLRLATAARASSRTSSCSPGCCSSRTARTRRRRAVNKQITRLAVVALVLLAALIVGDDVLADVGDAGLADRQDNALERVAQFTVNRGKIYAADGRRARDERAEEGRRPDATTSAGTRQGDLVRAHRRLLDRSRGPAPGSSSR